MHAYLMYSCASRIPGVPCLVRGCGCGAAGLWGWGLLTRLLGSADLLYLFTRVHVHVSHRHWGRDVHLIPTSTLTSSCPDYEGPDLGLTISLDDCVLFMSPALLSPQQGLIYIHIFIDMALVSSSQVWHLFSSKLRHGHLKFQR